MAHAIRKWQPTAQQAKLLEEALNTGLRRSVVAICKKANVPRRTFYNWLASDAGFRAAWSNLHTEAVTHHLPGVIAAALHKAQQGHVTACRLVLELAGVLKTRVEVTGKDGAPVEITGAKERLASRIAELAERKRAAKPAGGTERRRSE